MQIPLFCFALHFNANASGKTISSRVDNADDMDDRFQTISTPVDMECGRSDIHDKQRRIGSFCKITLVRVVLGMDTALRWHLAGC